jgi:hypothetical protein
MGKAHFSGCLSLVSELDLFPFIQKNANMLMIKCRAITEFGIP